MMVSATSQFGLDDTIQSTNKSKYHAQPGSLHTKQLDYDPKSSAFIPSQLTSDKVKEAKEQVTQLKNRSRIGTKPEWNSSTFTTPFIKERSKMRALSEFQSEKIEYDYRAPSVSQVYRNVVYVPKKNKFQVDEEKFIQMESRGKLNSRMVTNHNIVVRHERNMLLEEEKDQMLAGRPDWNRTTEFDRKLKDEMESTLIHNATMNTRKSLSRKKSSSRPILQDSYLPPAERERQRNEQNRLNKLEERRNIEQQQLRAKEEPKVLRLGLKEKMTATLLLESSLQSTSGDKQDNKHENDV